MFSIDGYKENSPDVNNPYNIIPGSKITMNGVGKSLTLIPIVNGKPDYNRRVVANPGDPDIDFGSDVEGVLEVPHAMFGNSVDLSQPYSTNPVFSKALRDTADNFNTVAPWAIGKTPYSSLSNPNAVQSPLGDPAAFRNVPKAPGLDLTTYSRASQDIKSNLESKATGMGFGDVNIDLNAAKNAVNNKRADGGFRSSFNPYVGLDLATAITSLGALSKYRPETGAQAVGKAVGMLGLSGKIGFEGARNFMLGRAAMNRQMQLETEQQRQARRNLNYRTGWFQEGGNVPSYKKGGHISKMATGHFIKGSDEHPTPNSEVERGEYVQTPDGQTMEVLGKRHSEGGELLNLPAGTKIVSDYVKIGSKLARYFKKEFGLNVTSGSKFATVLDLFKKKIGLEELLKEEESLINKMKDQESIKNDNTRELNMDLLREKYQDIQPRKQDLERKFQTFTNLVFDRQESLKNSKNNTEIMKYYQQGGEMSQGMVPEAPQQQSGQLEQIIMTYAQITGQDPNLIMTQFEQSSPDQQREIIEEMLDTIEDAQEQQMRPAQSDEDPEGLMAQQRQMEQQVMQGQAPQMRKGGYIKKYQMGDTVGSAFTQSTDVGMTPYDRARAFVRSADNSQNLYQGHAEKLAEINGKYYRVYGQGNDTFMQDAAVPETDTFLYNRGIVKTAPEGYAQEVVKPTLAVEVLSKPVKATAENTVSYDSEEYKTKLKKAAMDEALKTLPKKTKEAVKKEANKIEKKADKELKKESAQAPIAAVEDNGDGTSTVVDADGNVSIVDTAAVADTIAAPVVDSAVVASDSIAVSAPTVRPSTTVRPSANIEVAEDQGFTAGQIAAGAGVGAAALAGAWYGGKRLAGPVRRVYSNVSGKIGRVMDRVRGRGATVATPVQSVVPTSNQTKTTKQSGRGLVNRMRSVANVYDKAKAKVGSIKTASWNLYNRLTTPVNRSTVPESQVLRNSNHIKDQRIAHINAQVESEVRQRALELAQQEEALRGRMDARRRAADVEYSKHISAKAASKNRAEALKKGWKKGKVSGRVGKALGIGAAGALLYNVGRQSISNASSNYQ